MKLAQIIAKYHDQLEKVQRESCALISSKVVSRTPVDTGSLRASWTPSNGEPKATNITIRFTTNQSQPRHDITAVINSLSIGDTYSLANGQEYVREIEYTGHSPQAPEGMMRRSIAEWQQIVNTATRKTK